MKNGEINKVLNDIYRIAHCFANKKDVKKLENRIDEILIYFGNHYNHYVKSVEGERLKRGFRIIKKKMNKEIELKDDITSESYWSDWQLRCLGRLMERSCDWCPRTYIVQVNDNGRYRQ